MYQLIVDNARVGTFPSLDEAKRDAAQLAGMPLLFDITVTTGTPTEWNAVVDEHVYRITLAQGEVID